MNQSISIAKNRHGIPWERPIQVFSFNQTYQTEFRKSQIENAGFGWWANCNIPANVKLRSFNIADSTLLRFENEQELLATNWNINEMVNYGIGHKLDTSAIFFLKPGIRMNHADPLREPSVVYKFPQKDSIEIWTIKAIAKGEEFFNNYGYDFVECNWYDDFQMRHGNMPISMIAEELNKAVFEKQKKVQTRK